jgi:hypothetical protein
MSTTVKSLAGTGKDYCEFIVEVANGFRGKPQTATLVTSCGCGNIMRAPLENLELPINFPPGMHKLQAKLIGGYGDKRQAHIQFRAPPGMAGNRSYGLAWDSDDAVLIAELSK